MALLAGCTAPPPTTPVPASPSAVWNGSNFPAQDIGLTAAAPALAARWRPYGVSLIPGEGVVAAELTIATAVPMSNHSSGAFTNTQMMGFVVAEVRDQLLAGWAGEHVQPSLDAHLSGEPFLIGVDAHAIADGTAVHYPPCALIPTSITLLAPSPALDVALAAESAYVAPTSIPMRVTYAGCAVTATTGSGVTVTLDPAVGSVTLVLDYVLRHDPVLGDVLFAESAAPCPSTITAIAAACSG